MNYDSETLTIILLLFFGLHAIVIYRGGKGNVLESGSNKSSPSDPESTLSRQISSADNPVKNFFFFCFGGVALICLGLHLHSKKLI